MKLDDPGLHNDVVRLDLLTQADRELVAREDTIAAMWSWLPVIGTGTNFDAYYDAVMNSAKLDQLVPFKVTRQSDDAFAGLVGFEAISRTHRRLRIAYAWHPADMRGTAIGPATQLAMLERAKASRFRRIEYMFADHNARAIASVERLGACREGTLRNHVRLTGGGWANVVVLSLIDNEIGAAITILRDRVAAFHEA